MYQDDYYHHLVPGAPFTDADVYTGLRAMLGDREALSRAVAWPGLRWDAVRYFIRRTELVETLGQLTRLTRRGRQAYRRLDRRYR
jgi:hypothetical protein